MAAPQIPNLLSGLGRGRGRGNNRGGRGGGLRSDRSQAPSPPSFTGTQTPSRADLLVQGTDTDASVSRMSAVYVGYLTDPFAEAMMPRETTLANVRRFPIINRGTYVRTTAIDRLVAAFLATNPTTQKQIISLGAGHDTRYFRVQEGQRKAQAELDSREAARKADIEAQGEAYTAQATGVPPIIYHELDFPEVAKAKMARIASSPKLSGPGSPFWRYAHTGDGRVNTSTYNLHPVDLRAMPETLPNLSECPTLLISECCLCYMTPAETESVLGWFERRIMTLGLVVYEPQRPDTQFGQTMTSNLAARGITMPTVHKYKNLGMQMERLESAGFEVQDGADVDWLWDNWITREEKARVSRLEMLDEVEEWKLLGQHYLVFWGWRETDTPDGRGTFNKWKEACRGQNASLVGEKDQQSGSETE